MVCQSIAAGQDFGAKGTKNLIRRQQELITEKNDRLAACVKKAGSFGTVFLGKQTKSVERLFTNMVLHAFRVATGNFRTDAQHQQEIFDYLMSLAAFLRQLLSFCR